MSALRLGTRLALCAGLGLFLIGCGSAPAQETEGAAGSNVPQFDGFPNSNAGQPAADGFKGWRRPGDGAAAGMPAAVAGSSGAAGKTPAAGGGGAGGTAGTAGSAAGASAAGSGTTAAQDPLDVLGLGSAGAPADDPFDIFNAAPGMISCVGFFCTELADCTSLYPTEHAACKFTQCVDLECK